MPSKDTLINAIPLTESKLSEYDLLKDVKWLRFSIFGNSLHNYILTILAFFVIWAVLAGSRRYIERQIKRFHDGREDSIWGLLYDLIGGIKPYVFPVLAFFMAVSGLSLPDLAHSALHFLAVTVVTVQVVRILGAVIVFVVVHARGGKGDDGAAHSTNDNIAVLIRVGLWMAAGVFLLENAGYNVSTFIAGLGIGGVAIALAVQAILGDTVSSFALALDKPFEVGDVINVDGLQGSVEHIGLKTTRVRSVGGELMVFANSDLTKSRIRNFKRMQQRRIVFKINIHPQTPASKLPLIPDILATAVRSQPDTKLDRAHFLTFGDSALIFEVAYTVTQADYSLYCNIQQAINYNISEALAKQGIAMAFLPTVASL